MLLLLLACTAPKDAADDTAAVADSGDTDAVDSGDTDLPDGLNGTAPDAPVALPTFTARNQAGETRTDADLLGHPTVMWFYPAAGTYG